MFIFLVHKYSISAVRKQTKKIIKEQDLSVPDAKKYVLHMVIDKHYNLETREPYQDALMVKLDNHYFKKRGEGNK